MNSIGGYLIAFGVALGTLPAISNAQFTFVTNGGVLTLTGYAGSDRAVTIPATTNGLQVRSIGSHAFDSKPVLTSVTIPSSVTNYAISVVFYNCSNLTAAFFEGNAPRDYTPGG